MARILSLLLILAFVAFGLAFGTLNEQPAEADFFFFQLNLPLALLLMGAFLAGVILSGGLVYTAMWLGVRRRIASLKKHQKSTAARDLTVSNG